MESEKNININEINYKKKVSIQEDAKDIASLIDNLREVFLSNYIDCNYCGEKTFICINGSNDEVKKINNTQKILDVSKEVFLNLLIHLYKQEIEYVCLNTRKNQSVSVKTLNYKKLKRVFITTFIAILFCLTNQIATNILLTTILSYNAICTFTKCSMLIYGIIKYKNKKDAEKKQKNNKECILIANKTLPKYTVIVPMLRENEETISQIVKSMTAINYPVDKLEIFFALEEDDEKTKNVLQKVKMPKNITNIWIPYFEPRTKPKACNIASLFASGEYIVIYDAEDIPDVEQLIKSVNQFQLESQEDCNNTNKKTSVLQGCLSFYNNHKNLLTECFNIEYLVHFKFLLYTYSLKGITIPLGGTSNHIKTKDLINSNLWDSFNVTEDLELSTIMQNSTKIKYLDSDTKEWCVDSIKAWIKQRVRWMKGYILTYIICLVKEFCNKKSKSPNNHKTLFNQKIKNIIFNHIVIGYTFFAFLFLPLTLYSFLASNSPLIINYIFLTTSVLYYSTIILSYIMICKKNMINITAKTFLAFTIYPFYFILHCIATFIAIFDIIKRPFYWDKTEHNISYSPANVNT